MPETIVNFYTGAEDDGTAGDFADSASAALYAWLISTDAGNAAQAKLYTLITDATSGIKTWRSQTPWQTFSQGAEGGNIPVAYIWTSHIGMRYRETTRLNPAFQTTITLIHAHADLETNRIRVHKLAQYIGARLAQAEFSGSIVQGNSAWFYHYWNFQEPIAYTIDPVELTGTEANAHVYALQIAFEWEHSDPRS